MFKRVIAFILLLTFAAQTFAGPFIVMDYLINKETYAKNCINKGKPKMHCNGKCQLMKKMKAEEKQGQQNKEQRSVTKIQVLSSESFFSSLAIPARFSSRLLYREIVDTPLVRQLAVFHPPPQV